MHALRQRSQSNLLTHNGLDCHFIATDLTADKNILPVFFTMRQARHSREIQLINIILGALSCIKGMTILLPLYTYMMSMAE